MIRMVAFLMLVIPFELFGQKDSVDIWLSKIDNRSIAGTCHYSWVLEPTVEEVNKLIGVGKPIERKLLKMMNNEKEDVVAHYILSNIYKQTNYKTLGIDTVTAIITYNYNGLVFYEKRFGMVADKPSLEKCRRDWIKKFKD